MEISSKEHTHEAYSDESNHNNPGYGSITLFSFEKRFRQDTNENLSKILKESNVKELKWNKIRSAKDRHCAIKIIDYLFSIYRTTKFRIDTTIWDTSERKNKYNQNNIDALKRMYHQLFKNVIAKRWPSDSIWKIFPDIHTEIDWTKSQEILGYVIHHEVKIKDASSIDTPLIQIADIFCGMGAFSHSNNKLNMLSKGQTCLFGDKNNTSHSEIEKMTVISHLKRKCKEEGFDIEKSNKLNTKDPKCPINFWLFEFNDYNNSNLNKFL